MSSPSLHLVDGTSNKSVPFISHQETGCDSPWTTGTFHLQDDPFPALNSYQDAESFPSQEALIQQGLDARRVAVKDALIQKGVKENKAAAKAAKKIEEKQRVLRTGIESSLVARPSLRAEVTFEQPPTNPKLQKIATQQFSATYKMVQNSSFNGQRINEDGIPRVIEGAISSSYDRYAPNLTMARQMELHNETTGITETIGYAGRPDTETKFQELASLVFLGEKEKGHLVEQVDAEGRVYYKLTFVMNSFIGTTPFGKAEYKLIEKEHEELQNFNGSTITITDEEGTSYQVECDILFFSRQFNFTNRLEENLPEDLSGDRKSQEISHTVADLETRLCDFAKSRPLVKASLEQLKKGNLDATEEIFYRTLICQQAGIPLVTHCRSCIDRTSIATSIAYTLRIWQLCGLEIPLEAPHTIMDDEAFKEMWYAHVAGAHHLSAYSRKDYGFKWQTTPCPQVTQHPAVLRLIPKRYLAPLNLHTFKPENFAWKAFFAAWVSGGILAWRSPTKTFEWCKAKETQGITRVKEVAWRILKVITYSVSALIAIILVFAFGEALGIVDLLSLGKLREKLTRCKTFAFNPLTDLFLGFRLAYAVCNSFPNQIVRTGVELNGEPLFSGEKIDREPLPVV